MCVTRPIVALLTPYQVSGKSNNHKPKPPKSTIIAAKTIKDSQPRVPQYSALTIAKRNFLTADDEVLRFVPYFGDAVSSKKAAGHKRLIKELEEAYSSIKITTREAELASQIRGYLDSWLAELVDLKLTEQILQRYILQQGHVQKNAKISKIILRSLGGPLQGDLMERATSFEVAFQSIFRLDLRDVVLPESHLRELAKKLKAPAESAPPGQAVFSTFADFICLICGVAYCQIHGDYSHNPVYHLDGSESSGEGNMEYEYDYQPLGMSYADSLRKHDVRISNMEQDEDDRSRQDLVPCTEACYLSDEFEDLDIQWPRDKLNTLKEFLAIFTNQDDQSCNISAAINIPCWQVHREIRKYEKPSGREIVERRTPKKAGPSERPNWYNNEKKTLHSHFEDMTKAHNHEEGTQLNPVSI